MNYSQAQDDGRVYSPWEISKLATAGLGRLSFAGALGALLLLAAEFSLSGFSPTLGLARLSLLGALALSIGISVLVRSRKVNTPQPLWLGVALAWTLGAAGALAAATYGGFLGPLGFGLVPVLLCWPLVMPGGAPWAAGAIVGAVVIHLSVFNAYVAGPWFDAGPGRAVAALLCLSSAAAVAAAHLIETWRARAANLSPDDWLTHALSRSALETQLTGLCLKRQRSLASLTLVMFDLDRFRDLNSLHGRGAGDEVLELLVSTVKAELRASDFVGRYGGDEFVLVLDECESTAAAALLDRLRQRLSAKPLSVGGEQVRVSFSAGVVSVAPGDAYTARDLLRAVERALVASKDQARNRTSFAPAYSSVVTPPPPPPPGTSAVLSADILVSGEVPATDPLAASTQAL